MRRHVAALCAAAGLLAPTASAADSTAALIVLTTVGFMTGAADGCKVESEKSNALASGMALAISGGKYGDAAQAHTLFNNARQRGVAEAASGKVDCSMVASRIRDLTTELHK